MPLADSLLLYQKNKLWAVNNKKGISLSFMPQKFFDIVDAIKQKRMLAAEQRQLNAKRHHSVEEETKARKYTNSRLISKAFMNLEAIGPLKAEQMLEFVDRLKACKTPADRKKVGLFYR